VAVQESRTATPEEAREEARRSLAPIIRREREAEFQIEFTERWTSRTICAQGFVVDRCRDAPIPQAPGAPPVISTRPVSPGSAGAAGAVIAQGEAQGPLPPPSTPVPGEGISPRAQPLIPGGQAGGP
jgi:hypothetical protein